MFVHYLQSWRSLPGSEAKATTCFGPLSSPCHFFFFWCLWFFLFFSVSVFRSSCGSFPFVCLLLPPDILYFFSVFFCLLLSLLVSLFSFPFCPVSLVFSSSPFSAPPLFFSSPLPIRSPPWLFILVLTFFSLSFLCFFLPPSVRSLLWLL